MQCYPPPVAKGEGGGANTNGENAESAPLLGYWLASLLFQDPRCFLSYKCFRPPGPVLFSDKGQGGSKDRRETGYRGFGVTWQ